MKIDHSRSEMTQETLQFYCRYDYMTGDFWRVTRFDSWGNTKVINKLVTSKNNRGYKWLNIFGKMYLVHRLAFLYMTGNHPTNEVDHINGDRTDNRWLNLRECDSSTNSRNQGIRKDCTSGVRGVNYNTAKSSRSLKRWVARISHQGERIMLGNFETFEEAVAARKKAEIDLGYHPNHAKRKSWSE
jgi:hypothetical protein